MAIILLGLLLRGKFVSFDVYIFLSKCTLIYNETQTRLFYFYFPIKSILRVTVGFNTTLLFT